MKNELLFCIESESEAATEAAGARLASLLPPPHAGEYPVVALNGELGAGKTVFVRGMASLLSPGAPVRSPTYTIVNEYPGDPPLLHFDLYRIQSEDDLLSIGYDEYPARGVTVVEWSENVPGALPPCHFRVTVAKTGASTRRITAERVEQ